MLNATILWIYSDFKIGTDTLFNFCGAAGSRTPVQRKNPLTFYMLSFLFGCRLRSRLRNHLSKAYSLNLVSYPGLASDQSEKVWCATGAYQTSAPLHRSKLIPRIKLQRQKLYCHLWFDNRFLRSVLSSYGMLTNQSHFLSIPVSPLYFYK